jgi:putative membrane protein
MSWKLILVLVLLVLLAIFTVQNYEAVTIQFLFWSFSTSSAIVIFSTLVIGVIVGWIVSYIVSKQNW